MRWIGLLAVGLVVAQPDSAAAQGVTHANLVGKWLRIQEYTRADGAQEKRDWYLTFRADSTWEKVALKNGSADPEIPAQSGHWYLSGDSLWLGDPGVTDTAFYALSQYLGGEAKQKWPPNHVGLNGERLSFFDYPLWDVWKKEHPGQQFPTPESITGKWTYFTRTGASQP